MPSIAQRDFNTCRCFSVAGIPDELKELPRWVRFDLERTARGKLRKTPYIPATMAEASNRNPAHWRPYEAAIADALTREQYVGFVFDRSLPYVFVDLDNTRGAGGVLRSGAARVVGTLRSHTETSASGTGLHVVCRGRLPERILIAPDLRPIEVYHLRGPRFCVFTGHLLAVEGNLETGIPDRSAELTTLFPAKPLQVANSKSATHVGPLGTLTDDEIGSIVEWADPFWADGRRHYMALYLSGELCRLGVTREQAVAVIERCAARDTDPGAKITACRDTFDDAEAGAEYSGYYGLRDIGLTDDDLEPLTSVLNGFWQRSHPRLVLGDRLRAGRFHLRVREVSHA